MAWFRNVWTFIYRSGKEEAFWSSVKWLVWSKLGVAAMLDSFAAYLAWEKLDAWQIFGGLLLVTLIAIWCVNGVVFYLFPYWKAKTTSNPSKGMVEFFPHRSALEERYPRREILREGNECYGYFLSGEGLFSWNPDSLRYMKRIILPRPNAAYLQMLQSMSVNKYLQAPQQIKTTTKMAKEHGVEIKWFDDFIGMGILFCNPEESAGWIQIEISIPFVEAENKQAIRIEKESHPEVFKKLYEAYKTMWDNSRTPDPRDYEEQI